MGKSKKVNQKWKRWKIFDTCFSVMFSCYGPSVIFRRGCTLGSASNQIWDFSDISYFFNILSLKLLGNSYGNLYKSFIILEIKPAVLIINQTYTKTLNCFITSFPPFEEAVARSVTYVIDFYCTMGLAFENKVTSTRLFRRNEPMLFQNGGVPKTDI